MAKFHMSNGRQCPKKVGFFFIDDGTVTLLCVCSLILFSTAPAVDEKNGLLCLELQNIAHGLMICLHRYRLGVIATVAGKFFGCMGLYRSISSRFLSVVIPHCPVFASSSDLS